jgi:MFS family permease
VSFSTLRNIRHLSPAPRRFLLVISLNVLSWHSLVGPVLVLFSREIHMPPSWVGFIVSFVPLSMLLAFVTVPIVEWFGPKRLMLITWGGRNVVACLAFALPWVLLHGQPRHGWLLLLLSILGFCAIRSIGVGGWFPWLHEIVPARERSTYFAAESSIEHSVIVCTNVMHMIILSFTPTLYHYLGIYVIGVIAGILSMWFMVRVPGGTRIAAHERVGINPAMYRKVLKDYEFLPFVALAALGFASVSFLTTTSVMYMRDALQCSPRFIMMVLTANSTLVFFTVRYWSSFAEQQGTARGIFLTMLGHGLLAIAALFQAPGAVFTLYILPVVFMFAAAMAVAFSVISHRAMLDFVKAEARVAYTNIWILGASLALGLSPIAVGFSIDHLDLWGYRLNFLVSAIFGLSVSAMSMFVLHKSTPAERIAAGSLNPFFPISAVGRILWITLGLHPSARFRPMKEDKE